MLQDRLVQTDGAHLFYRNVLQYCIIACFMEMGLRQWVHDVPSNIIS